MKYLIIVVEGQTEQEFVNDILRPYFAEHGIYHVSARLIRTSRSGKGGFVNFQHLQNDVNKILTKEQDAVVTTFFDFFRCPTNMPGYEEAIKKENHQEAVEILETKMDELFGNTHFVPYIQLHEFEALLFSSNKGFETYWEDEQTEKAMEIIAQYPNPEDINSRPEKAPSKRIIEIKSDYDKVAEGNLLAMEIGIEEMLNHCPRFKQWIERLIKQFVL
jgi:hypothetical protein